MASHLDDDIAMLIDSTCLSALQETKKVIETGAEISEGRSALLIEGLRLIQARRMAQWPMPPLVALAPAVDPFQDKLNEMFERTEKFMDKAGITKEPEGEQIEADPI